MEAMLTKDEARQKIIELVQKYVSQAETYEQADYNEARVRIDFINPLFKILGWDMDNEKGMTQYLREVLLEDRVHIEGRVKHPDYAFRLGNTVLFYVEAKKPSVNIKEDKESALQLRHYGWNTGLTMSLLTNFRDFAVYDCRVKPNHKDKAHVARLTYFTYQDLLEKQGVFGDLRDGFDFLWDTFTQENVGKGSFQKFIKDDGDRFKRGVLMVDQDFLQFLEDRRQAFATMIFRANKNLTEWELNFAVQQTLLRAVFLRFAEDRGIEPIGDLAKAVQPSGVGECYKNLYEQFELADDKYNSGLFDMSKDHVCRNLIVDNKLLKDFIAGLYYPGPYNFKAMPVEILGSAYERFLGKTIRISGRGAKVEEKPEVRKAGGVYYTPQYIVDYIVENTIGKQLEGKTPKEAEKIKIVDPACGSGSFLLGAYQFLLDWHHNYYAQHLPPSKGKRTDPLTPDGYLTIDEKKRILANNIFGVDLDVNAVEFTKLSLLLKCMEGEHASVFQRLKIYGERLLPNIDGNIPVGNSLIDTDFYDVFPDDEAERKIKPFNWQRAFPDAFKQGGFDCVIGNPPWGADLIADKSYFKSHFENTTPDSAAYFLEQAQKLSKSAIGMIVPKTIAFYASWQSIREVLLKQCRLNRVLDVGVAFPQVNLESVILILDKATGEQSHPKIMRGMPLKLPHIPKEIVALGEFDARITSITRSLPMIGLSKKEANLIWKLYKHSVQLGDVADSIFRGLYIPDSQKETLRRGKTKWINKVPDVKRWFLSKVNSIALPSEYKTKAQKVMIPRVFLKVLRGSRLVAFPDTNGEYLTTEKLVNVTISHEKYPVSYLFLCAVLNSPITSWYLQKILFSDTTETSRVMDRVYSQYIIFPPLDLAKKEDKQSHDKIVNCVDQLLRLYEEKETVVLSTNLYTIEDKIAHFERRIDEFVYQLYGLSDAEIAVVEGENP